MPSPIINATLQATVITFCSCLFATLLTPTPPPFLPLSIFTLIATPPNYLWQQFLERVFPGYATRKVEVDDDAGEKGVRWEKRLIIRNTAAKFGLDQTVGAVVNVVAFLAGVRLLRGASLAESWFVVKEQTWPLMWAGYKLWPAVSLISFTVVPVERRTLLASVVGFGWGVFLALQAAA